MVPVFVRIRFCLLCMNSMTILIVFLLTAVLLLSVLPCFRMVLISWLYPLMIPIFLYLLFSLKNNVMRDKWSFITTTVIFDSQGREMVSKKVPYSNGDPFEVAINCFSSVQRFSAPGNSCCVTLFNLKRKKYEYQFLKIY